SNYNFRYEVIYPTVQLSLLVPPDLNVNSSTLTSAGLITADQHPYRLFQAKDLLAGTHIQAQLQGLPVPQSQSSPGPLNQNTTWLIVAILLMLAILTITWFILRSTRRDRDQRRRGRLIAPSADLSARGNGTANDNLPGQQQDLLQELLDLDEAYAAGKLKKSLYQERRAKTKARLRALMAETGEKTAKSKGVS
ncbi:MAG TPA: hypothetical protein VFN02_16330, partial [Ktedonobacteraceae bacterium]|nr:hypothetical protein [Ktedonobacteraceae bacterium]